MLHAPALEGRPGRAGAGEQPVAIAQHHLPVGPDIYIESELVGIEDARRQHSCRYVPADVARYAGDGVEIDSRGYPESQVRRLHPGEEGARRDIGLFPDVLGVQPQQQVHHGGVSGHHDMSYIAVLYVSRLHQGLDEVPHGPHHYRLELRQPGSLGGVDYARDNVLAEGDLRVVVRGAGRHLARLQVDELGADGGRSDVYGDRGLPLAGVALLDAHGP